MKELEYPFDNGFIMKKKRSLKRQLLGDGAVRLKKRVAVLGGSTTDDIVSVLELFLLDMGFECEFYRSEYGQFWQDAVFSNEELDRFKPDIVYIHTSLRNLSFSPTPRSGEEEIEQGLNAELDRLSQAWDGVIHDKYRCGTHERVMENIALYKEVNGKYPSMNCTVGKEIIDNPEATIGFFEQFGNRITFSRMIGKQGISLPDFNAFLNKAMERLNVRTGGYDCTMYGGMCGAGMDNIFYANGKIFICGNCIDLPFSMPYDTPLNEVSFDVIDFDRSCCFKEVFTG